MQGSFKLLFLNFEQKCASCSYKIVFIKKDYNLKNNAENIIFTISLK